MAKRVLTETHYLPADGLQLLLRILQDDPILYGGALIALVGLAYWAVRSRFDRDGGDLLLVAVFFVAVGLLGAACLYLLFTTPGYRIYHPGF